MDKMIVYEDNVLLVVHKPVGIATETARVGQADLVSELKNYRKKKGEDTYIGVIHRLDQPVEGLLVFAKDAKTARKLGDELRKGTLKKKYAALAAGIVQAPEGKLTDYLLKDGRTNLSTVVAKETKGAKKAVLCWKLLRQKESVSLLEIELYTGRHHQIRVQMAHAGFPLLGDFKYGTAASKELSNIFAVNSTALLAYEVQLMHPVTGRTMKFSLELDRFVKIF
ncbi:MAG: RluA family pseudouridine synthase [Lachnospiraceae bacterium]|nr:RluA family pseudouridine synthase [Lachnospiraceae bacterium]